MKFYKNIFTIALSLLLLVSCKKDLQSSEQQNEALMKADLQQKDGAPGWVFTLSNQVAENKLLAYQRTAKGELSFVASYSTGGTGTGGGLGNQGALTLTENSQWLLAVNPGSNSISLFDVGGSKIKLVSQVASGGNLPVSISVHKNLVYVLNAGENANVSGFMIDNKGMLSPVSSSTRVLPGTMAGAAQVSLVNNGQVVVVTQKATNKIITYTVDDNGRTGMMHMIASAYPTPFGFAADKNGIIYVSEAIGGAANQSAVSSYMVQDDGTISPLNGPVFAGQTAACWVVLTNNSKYLFATNTGSSTITSFMADKKGGFSVVEAAISSGPTPIDAALSNNDKLLFVLNSGNESISSFMVENNGQLQLVQHIQGLPDGATGLAAK